MADVISITRNSIAKADNISINLVRYCIHATNNANSTGIFFYINTTKIEVPTRHIFISVSYCITGTLNSNTVRVFDCICRTKNTICYAGIRLIIIFDFTLSTNNSCCSTGVSSHIINFAICTNNSSI